MRPVGVAVVGAAVMALALALAHRSKAVPRGYVHPLVVHQRMLAQREAELERARPIGFETNEAGGKPWTGGGPQR